MIDLPNHWKIGLSSWIIQDGNYNDFAVGQNAEFALEFYPQKVDVGDLVRQKTFQRTGPCEYRISAEIIYHTPEVWVLDFGIRAYQEAKPPASFSVGQFVIAEIYLGIDKFSYFESFNRLPGMPPLIYSWSIISIEIQTAPFIDSFDTAGRRIRMRDEKKLGYKRIDKTDAWHDDEGMAEYQLTCRKLDVPPLQKSDFRK